MKLTVNLKFSNISLPIKAFSNSLAFSSTGKLKPTTVFIFLLWKVISAQKIFVSGALNNKKPDYIIGEGRWEKKTKQRIVIDNKIRHGKPIIKGTRITVDEVLGALVGGMTYEEIEREYGIRREDILERYCGLRQRMIYYGHQQ